MSKILSLLSSNKFMLRNMVLIKRIIIRSFLLVSRLKPIDKNKVIFTNFTGRGFGDNPKAVAEKLHELYPDADIVWTVKGQAEKTLPEYIRSIPYDSLTYYKEMATAGVWVNNCRISAAMIKRKGQLYVQLWHGGVPLKKIEKDTERTLEKSYIEHARHDSSIIDIIISGCDYFTDIVKKSFWYNGEILECGTPRLDGIFNVSPEKAVEIRKNAGWAQDKKVILYVPTFRADLSTDCYRIDFEAVLDALEKKTGDKWIFAVRLHPNLAEKADFINYSDRVLNATPYPDLYELLPVCDAVVSDYSSVMFEAGMIGKTVFLYATDIEDYKKDRELYFEMNELPFVLAENNDEFIAAVRDFDKEKYESELNAFNKEMNYCENGNSSAIIAERIIRHITNG